MYICAFTYVPGNDDGDEHRQKVRQLPGDLEDNDSAGDAAGHASRHSSCGLGRVEGKRIEEMFIHVHEHACARCELMRTDGVGSVYACWKVVGSASALRLHMLTTQHACRNMRSDTRHEEEGMACTNALQHERQQEETLAKHKNSAITRARRTRRKTIQPPIKTAYSTCTRMYTHTWEHT